jgi:hypothetical protein
MKYLGFPLSDKRLGMSAFKGIVGKMKKKLQPLKGKHLTSGECDRTTQNNSVLSPKPVHVAIKQ